LNEPARKSWWVVGRKLEDLIEEGLRLVLEAPPEEQRRHSLAALMKHARGAIDSGVPDLASNPKHLAGFGRREGDGDEEGA
jgi:hypothetical protein